MEEIKTTPPQVEEKKQHGNFQLLALVLVIAAVSFFAGRMSADSGDTPETQTVWKMTKYDTTFINSDGTSSELSTYEYDSQGRLLHMNLEDPDHIYEKYYDENENLTQTLQYNSASGHLMKRIEESYDESGNLLSNTTYDADGSIINRSEFSYDEKGRRLTEARGENGAPCELTITCEYTDTPDGGYTCVEHYLDLENDGENSYTETTVFDANGNLLRNEREYLSDGSKRIVTLEYAAFEVPVDQISKEDPQ